MEARFCFPSSIRSIWFLSVIYLSSSFELSFFAVLKVSFRQGRPTSILFGGGGLQFGMPLSFTVYVDLRW